MGRTVHTGYQYALEHGYDVAVQVDGSTTLVGSDACWSRFETTPTLSRHSLRQGGGYRGTRLRRVGIHTFVSVVSLMVGQRVSDTTSGFRAVNRKALRLFAAQYPHDYPEVESIVLLSRHGLRMLAVPVRMRVRETGASSITALRAAYYMIKVLLALFIGLFRRYPTPQEEQ
jgi:hypothetical protein